ncbi:uncharacterized protein EV154DRAFT_557031 [Mucor mucedo]|uniref:uncharacterized protein n=1 Tax=Mucor mucedo TaxID=29922 RepID=UPI0022201BF4|nr:uncharacterized protein EV154DRAFT_557031 [Mucor mucedo]KAI7867057.1 hypothetical protein EV154DRAFT_557031 [Mucor mucedo]
MKSFSLYLLSTLVVSSQAFCIYNHTPDTAFFMRQMTMNTGGTYSSRFKNENFRPEEKDCCSYTNSDCNKSGGPGDIITIAFLGNYNGVDNDHWFTATLPAGGWLDLYGGGSTGEAVSVRGHEADGTLFTPEIQVDVKGILLT